MTPYFQAKGVTLFHGDCREVLPSLTWDVCLTDPPYSVEVVERSRSSRKHSMLGPGANTVQATEFVYDGLGLEEIPSFASILGGTKRWLGLFSGVEEMHLWRAALEASGLRYIRTCVWDKSSNPTPQFSGDRPGQGWEPMTVCHGPGVRLRWNGGGSPGLWRDTVPGSLRTYPGQKPEILMRRLVRLFSDEGETVLDAFAGSGTTLVAALQLNRKAIGVELREESCELIAKRIERELSQGNLFQEQTA